MIARFGVDEITGVHLTKLLIDGSTKAGTDKDKIMIGPSVAQPIEVFNNPERGELAIAEGIEDAASIAIATGWSAWAAGAAVRIPSVVARAVSFDRIFLAVDYDKAGKVALAKSLGIRPDLVPLQFSQKLSLSQKLDANKVLIRLGPEMLLAVIEWSEVQVDYRRGKIGFEAMKRAQVNAEGLFKRLLDDEP